MFRTKCLLLLLQRFNSEVGRALYAGWLFNERQRQVLNRLLDGFDGHLTPSKWAKLTNCSPHTALRDINDLVEGRILAKEPAGGRSTHYVLNLPASS